MLEPVLLGTTATDPDGALSLALAEAGERGGEVPSDDPERSDQWAALTGLHTLLWASHLFLLSPRTGRDRAKRNLTC